MKVTKICTKCGVEKNVREFYEYEHGRYGVRADCKKCVYNQHKIYLKIRSKHFVEIHRERVRAWRANNPDKNKLTRNRYFDNVLSAKEKQKRLELNDNYVKYLIKSQAKDQLNSKEIPANLISLKKASMQLKRQLKITNNE